MIELYYTQTCGRIVHIQFCALNTFIIYIHPNILLVLLSVVLSSAISPLIDSVYLRCINILNQ